MNYDEAKHEPKAKGFRFLTLFLKFFGISLIIAIIILFALLPSYLRTKSNQINHSNTDPTNANLPYT
jgi:predicted secreted protein